MFLYLIKGLVSLTISHISSYFLYSIILIIIEQELSHWEIKCMKKHFQLFFLSGNGETFLYKNQRKK